MNDTFILKGNIIDSKDLNQLRIIPNGYLICKNGICKGAFEKIPKEYQDFDLIDYQDKLIIPGLVDLHLHASQYAYHGTGMDVELIPWLTQIAFPEEEKFESVDYAKCAYSIFVRDLVKSPTTRACIFATKHTPATLALMDELENSGLVTYVGKVEMDRFASEKLNSIGTVNEVNQIKLWINESLKRYQNTYPILTPRFIPSCTQELLEELKNIELEYKLKVQSHLSENLDEIKWVSELEPTSKFYGDAYEKYHLFGSINKTIMAHCIYSSIDEINLMKKNGVFIAHCPASNMNVKSGIAPISKYLKIGLHVGLGTDVSGGETLSLFTTMKQAIQVSKLYWRLVDQTISPITLENAFFMGTRGGGEFFGNVGAFQDGYAFDCLILEDSELETIINLDLRERLERIIYCSNSSDVIEHKYVQGKKIF